jgi:molybdopterin synthase sulfur carrier subunit
MKVCVQLFAVARQLAGAKSVSIELTHGATVAELRTALSKAVPALGELLGRTAIAVNAEYAPEKMVIPASAEIALIPPVSGG